MQHTITKRFEFEAAHVLPWHKGQCGRLHGHSYKLEVDLTGKLNENGIVADFSELSELVKKIIVNKFDHQDLNAFFDNPTAEVMCEFFYDVLIKNWIGAGVISQVRLWETSKCFVSYPSLYDSKNK